jgi:hypothetical protein
VGRNPAGGGRHGAECALVAVALWRLELLVVVDMAIIEAALAHDSAGADVTVIAGLL